MLDNYMRDRTSDNRWSLNDIQVLSGLISYYRMVEKEYIDYVIQKCGEKHSSDVRNCIKADLSV